jgi:hypothetical protein
MRAQMGIHHALGPDKWLCPNAIEIALLSILSSALGGRKFTAGKWYAPIWNPASNIMRLKGGLATQAAAGRRAVQMCLVIGFCVSNIVTEHGNCWDAGKMKRETNMLQYARNRLEPISCLTSEHRLTTAAGSQLYIRVSGARLIDSRPCENPTLNHRPISFWRGSFGQEFTGIGIICSWISTNPRDASRPRVSVL